MMPEERPYRSNAARRPAAKPSKAGVQLLLVQSISCMVILLLALVMRLAGGAAFVQLRESFTNYMMDNSVLSAFTALFQSPAPAAGTSSEESAPASSEETAGTTSATVSAGESTAPSTTPSAGGATAPPTAAAMAQKITYAPQGATYALLRMNRAPVLPLSAGKISSPYGYRQNPTKEGTGFHLGLDIAAEKGMPIAAMYFGVVTAVGQDSTYGNYVKIYHGGNMEILYAHCSEIPVSKDAVIKAGETVAKVGSTGDSTGNHVHVEVRVNGIAYNPACLLPTGTYA